ncbi:hypothetical protein MIND_01153500 [Mycena indigotica]|uniref:Uncharacterized protein n=1 Tax=Mycena indigotica TaxID=2126181 RepID=A0A8H6VSP2_9AGAR|nr:uncharacterized protein MIND_01153500 [Mycena indigotica]KAF7292562.1 hypothetical protein MIND_01153500 [Mycena indigotica]
MATLALSPVSALHPHLRAPRPPIRIFDFAFPRTDPRALGGGDGVPHACRPELLNRRLNGSRCPSPVSVATDSDSEDDDDDYYERARRRVEAYFGPSIAGPSSGTGIPAGLYRAQFPFGAEGGAAEMPLEVGQLVYVIGPMEQDGDPDASGPRWAIARRTPVVVRPDLDIWQLHALVDVRTNIRIVWALLSGSLDQSGGGRGLVPEAFLVRIRAEGEQVEDARVRLEEYLGSSDTWTAPEEPDDESPELEAEQ